MRNKILILNVLNIYELYTYILKYKRNEHFFTAIKFTLKAKQILFYVHIFNQKNDVKN